MISHITNLINSIRIQDVLDIFITTVMISALLIWFKQRASRFVLIGISVLGFIYIAARFFQLYLTTAALQGFFAILLFVLVVIFQEDLRRFFERLAMLSSRLGKKAAPAPPRFPAAETIAATVGNMARNHVGALIVLKGHDPLERHIAGGIPLDGLVSQPLLESIFDPHSAGHDGAVIIDGNRIVRFACHLPLATGMETYGNMGLRHTAALGLAERSDALCIVVSEERGTVSIAKDETIETVTGPTALVSLIESHLAGTAPVTQVGWVNTWLRKNTREKVIALVLACVLWLMFGYQRETIQRELVVPIEYVNVSRQFIIDEPKSAAARVVLTGPPQAFQLLSPGSLKISLNLSQLREGTQEVVITKDMLSLPSNVTVVSITPAVIQVSASRPVSLSLPVEVVTEGRPPRGLVVARVAVHPSSVTVLVPSHVRPEKVRLQTEPINLSHMDETTTVETSLRFPPHVSFPQGKPPIVKVTVNLRSR